MNFRGILLVGAALAVLLGIAIFAPDFKSGTFYVFAASKEKKVLSTIELHEPISGTVTAANQRLYVATMSHLYALESQRREK